MARRILRGVVEISNAYDNYNYVKLLLNAVPLVMSQMYSQGSVATCYVSAHGDKKHANKKII